MLRATVTAYTNWFGQLSVRNTIQITRFSTSLDKGQPHFKDLISENFAIDKARYFMHYTHMLEYPAEFIILASVDRQSKIYLNPEDAKHVLNKLKEASKIQDRAYKSYFQTKVPTKNGDHREEISVKRDTTYEKQKIFIRTQNLDSKKSSRLRIYLAGVDEFISKLEEFLKKYDEIQKTKPN